MSHCVFACVVRKVQNNCQFKSDCFLVKAYHRIFELGGTSWDHLVRPILLKQGHLEEATLDCVKSDFDTLHNLSGQCVLVFDHLHMNNFFFSCVQMEFHAFYFVLIAFYTVTGHYQEESGSLIFIPSHKVTIHFDKIRPPPPAPKLLQAK